MAIFTMLLIGNGAVLKSSRQWQLKEFWKLNNCGHELFIFKILLIQSKVWFKMNPFQHPQSSLLAMTGPSSMDKSKILSMLTFNKPETEGF